VHFSGVYAQNKGFCEENACPAEALKELKESRTALNSKFTLPCAKILRKTCPRYHLHLPKQFYILSIY
jgi:hypothetical protein